MHKSLALTALTLTLPTTLATPPAHASAHASAHGTATAPVQAHVSELELPAPTGRRPVGTESLHLVDRSRRDPWNPDAEHRELMVTLWYPAKKAVGARAAYMTRAESEAVLADYDVPDKSVLSRIVTHARLKAPVAKGRLPLVVMSPGFSFPRATLTSLAEDFAARGYLVAAVEHTYESVGTTFPDGRTTSCLACEQRPDGADVAAGRVKDVRFVLDELLDGRWGRRIDREKIAMVGHSMGGYAAAQTMLADHRIKAGVNLDGTFKVGKPLKRPFMMIGTPSHAPGEGSGSWDEAWTHLKGPKRWITVADTDHSAFVDYALLRKPLGIPAQKLDGARALEITRAHLAAFADRHLLGRRTPVKDYPEVTDHSRTAAKAERPSGGA